MISFFVRVLIYSIVLCGMLPGFIQMPASCQREVEAHHDQLYLLSHEFVYLVTADIFGQRISLTLVKEGDGHFTTWVPDSNINTIYATAFRVDAAGHFATSRYAVEPWNNTYDQTVLKAVFSKELGLPESQITVGGMTRKIFLRKAGEKGEGTIIPVADPLLQYTGWLLWKDLSSAVRGNPSPDLIPAGSHPQGAGAINMKAGAGIQPDQAVYLYGYQPHGLADTLVQPAVLPLTVTTLSDGIARIRQTGSLPEGAPVFNSQGVFLGIYSAANRKTVQDPLVFYPVALRL
jgi:hypothetical protein